MKRYANMVEIMSHLRNAYPGSAWQFVTLTAQNCTPETLGETIDEMCRAWNSIASRATFKRRIAGWARALEVTYNERTKTVHPHFHILTMWQEGLDPIEDYVPNAWCETTLLKTARKAQNAQTIKAQEDTWHDDEISGAVLETYKYTTKSSDLEVMPLGIFKATAEAIKGRRLVAFGGKVKEYAKILGADDMDTPDEENAEHRASCINCEAAVRRVSAEWAGTHYVWRETT